MAFFTNLGERLDSLLFYKRLKNGTHQYLYIDSNSSWDSLSDKLQCGYTNPVLLPILQLISFYTTKVNFQVRDVNTKKIDPDHPLVTKLNNPNLFQSKQDLLKQFIWLKYCCGYTYMYPIMPAAFDESKDLLALYNLNTALIDFPKNFHTKFVFLEQDINNTKQNPFVYDLNGQNLTLTIKDIIPFYDLPNGMDRKNMLTAPSRLDALKKPLTNISRAFDAKNIAIKSNGKELFKNKSGSSVMSVPLADNEKQDIQDKTNDQYGLAVNRSRTIITNSDIEWQSLHIDLKELGLDDSVVKDAQMVVSAFNVPKELISYDGKGAKYENQVQATVGFIQGVVQDNVDDICNSLTSQFNMVEKEGKELIGSFDHLPIMQVVEERKNKALKEKIETLQLMLDAGIDAKDAMNMIGLSDIKLIPIPK